MSIPEHWPTHVKRRAGQFLALWKYYRYSRTLSEAAVPLVGPFLERAPLGRDDLLRGAALLSYWIASLEVLCEGWAELGLTDAAVDELLTPERRSTLRKYRHTVFHFQGDLEEPRIVALEADPPSVRWVFSLGEAFQAFFERHSDGIDVEHIRPWLFRPAV